MGDNIKIVTTTPTIVGTGKTCLPVSRSLKSSDLDPLKAGPDRIKIACSSEKVTVPFIMYPTNLPITKTNQVEDDPLALEEEPKESIEKRFREIAPKPIIIVLKPEPLPHLKPIIEATPCSIQGDLLDHSKEIKPFKCDHCEKTFTRRQSLKEHLNLHTRKCHKCPHCAKVFTRADKLKIHQVSQHPEHSNPGEVALSRIHKCDSCDMSFAYKSYLTAHVKIVHEKAKPFSCETCGKKFAKRHRLNEHLPIHSGEKPFKCHLCKNAFSRKQSLKNHMKYHTGENLFPCDVCGQEFNVRMHLIEHMRVHTGEKLFECHKCGKKFARKYSYKVHMRDVEKVDIRNEDLPSSHGLIVSDTFSESVDVTEDDEMHDVKDIDTVILNSNETVYSKILDCNKAGHSKANHQNVDFDPLLIKTEEIS